MSTLEQLAPELATCITEAQAKDLAKRTMGDDVVPAKPKKLAELTALEQADLLLWLRWFGAEKKPATTLTWFHDSPKQVAMRFGMEREYLMQLVAERDKIAGEVTKGDDAFKPDVKPIEEPKPEEPVVP
jgi:hypothetical protein